MREHAEDLLAAGDQVAGDPFSAETLGRALARRIAELGTASRILTAEIERPRVGPTRDIVVTIQPEQDELVRAELDESICVQGPGTGNPNTGLRHTFVCAIRR